MSEEKQVKRQLLKNVILNLITFAVIFTILGVIIYGQFKSSLYLSADSELERTNSIREFRMEREDRFAEKPRIPDNSNVQNKSPRLVFINRDADGNISQEGNLNDIFKSSSFDKTNLNNIYEITAILSIIKLTFGLMININVASIIGMVLAILIYKKI